MLTDAQIREIRERCEAGTLGPWYASEHGQMVLARDPYGHGIMRVADIRGWGHLTGAGACNMGDVEAAAIQDANLEFIASARQDIPALLAELDRLREGAKGAAVIADSAGQTIRELRAELEEAKRERDAAVHDLYKIAETLWPCCCCNELNCTECSNGGESGGYLWEWRGPVAENTPAPEMGAPGDGVVGGVEE